MKKSVFGWRSPRLGIDMPVVRYGDWGHALLLFPTAQADFLEYERFYLIKSIEHLIDAGRVQVFSIDSINRHAWMNNQVSIAEKTRRQAAYMGYVEEEVLPHIRLRLQDPTARIAVSGASFGAFHAGNALFRRPDLFDGLIGMSGFYDLSSYLRGYGAEEAYFNNPTWYVPNIHDGHQLELLKHHTQIHLISGQGAYEAPGASGRFSKILWDKGIGNNFDLWGHDVNHDWPWWRKMLPHYLGERMGY